jgi:hypothetical protein
VARRPRRAGGDRHRRGPLLLRGIRPGRVRKPGARSGDQKQLGPLPPRGLVLSQADDRSGQRAGIRGGFDLTLLCDLRIAGSEAVFAHPEVKSGGPPLFPPLRWIVGDGLARDLCLTGRRIDAAEAHWIGLVSRVVESERLLEEAASTARLIAEAPQAALEAAKRYLSANQGFGFEDSFRVEHDDVFDHFLGRGGLSNRD